MTDPIWGEVAHHMSKIIHVFDCDRESFDLWVDAEPTGHVVLYATTMAGFVGGISRHLGPAVSPAAWIYNNSAPGEPKLEEVFLPDNPTASIAALQSGNLPAEEIDLGDPNAINELLQQATCCESHLHATAASLLAGTIDLFLTLMDVHTQLHGKSCTKVNVPHPIAN